MWNDILKALGQTVVQQMGQAAAQVGYRQFIATLFTGDEQTAIARLRQHVQSFDDQHFALFLQTVQTMHAEAQVHLQQVHASGGNDAWGSSVEDRIALSMAQIRTGDYSVSRQAVAQAQQVVAGLEYVAKLSQQFRAEMNAGPSRARSAPPASSLSQKEADVVAAVDRRQERDMPKAQQSDIQRIEEMIDQLAETGEVPDGLMEAFTSLGDPEAMERLLQKMKDMGADQLGDRPLDNIADYYRGGEGLYEALWPIVVPLPLAFEELDRPTQFHVLFGECRRRLTEASLLRNQGRLDEATEAFRECVERADQIDVPILKSDAYQGLVTVFEKRGDRAQASRYLHMAERERARQAER